MKRLCTEAPSPGGDTTQRPVAVFRKCEGIREGRKTSAAPATIAPKNTGSSRKGHQRRRASVPQPALSPSRALSCMVFIEIFSGVGNLAAAMAKHTAYPVLLWDICLGPEYDLRSPAKRRLISGWVKSGWIVGLHLGTPCESFFSRARDVPPGPPPWRSNERPMGLDNLRPADQIKVINGNMFMRFSAFLLALCLRLGCQPQWRIHNEVEIGCVLQSLPSSVDAMCFGTSRITVPGESLSRKPQCSWQSTLL